MKTEGGKKAEGRRQKTVRSYPEPPCAVSLFSSLIPHPSSLRCLALVFALLQVGSGGESVAQSLRDKADKSGKLVGAAVNPRLFSEETYAATLAREFNMVEPENVMKWGAIRPDQKTFNFAPGDAVVAFAQAHKMKVRGHC